MKTPYFLIDEYKIKENINSFKCALEKYWKNSSIAYSVKTNSLPWILKYMLNNNILAEVVSDEEFLLAKKCGYSDEQIVFNGPIKSETAFVAAIKNNSVLNLDSKKEIEYLKNIEVIGNNIGLRVNINTSIFDKSDIGYFDDGFRFGFCEENGELKNVIEFIRSLNKDCRFGLHLHCNSITRSLNVYRSIAKYAAQIIKKYNLNPSYIDIGGGFFGGILGKPTAEEYIKTIIDEFSNVIDIEKTKLIIEPGSALIGSTIELYTSVIDVKDTCCSRIVTTDGSRIHIDPLWKKSKYFFTINSKNITKKEKQIICGYTCMDFDRLMTLNNEIELSIGDKIIYHNVGAYSVTFGGPFIKYFPEVYVKNSNCTVKVRKKMNIDDYYQIHGGELIL